MQLFISVVVTLLAVSSCTVDGSESDMQFSIVVKYPYKNLQVKTINA